MPRKLILNNSSKLRDSIVTSQKKKIKKLYVDWADDIHKRALFYKNKGTGSSYLEARRLEELEKQLREQSELISKEIYQGIKKDLYTISDSVVKDNVKWLKEIGFPTKGINAALSNVPDDVVTSIITGNVYKSGWSLSGRIWGNNEETLSDIYKIVAEGIAKNRPIYDIAKNLEKYVRPGAKLPWNLVMNDGKRIYKKNIDYNAQRLARTLVQHTYQQTFVVTTQNNPLIVDYIWWANGSRACEICKERDGKHFAKDDLPLDHPNGMCTMEANVISDIKGVLKDWFNSPDGTYPEIDEFAKNFGYNPNI